MGRLQVSVGTRYEREGRAFLVVQVLRDGRLLVEDQTDGGRSAVPRDELTGAWAGGTLRFAVEGPGIHRGDAGGLPTGYTISDFHLLPEGERAEAWRRYALIQPLLALPPGERTRPAIEEYLARAKTAGQGGEGQAAGATSRGSVERYLRAFEASRGDIRALAPTTTRSTAGESRLGDEVEEIIQGVLAEGTHISSGAHEPVVSHRRRGLRCLQQRTHLAPAILE